MKEIQWVKGNKKTNNREIKTSMGSCEMRVAGREAGVINVHLMDACFNFSNSKT